MPLAADEQPQPHAGFRLRAWAAMLDLALAALLTVPLLVTTYGWAYLRMERLYHGVGELIIAYLLPAALVLLCWVRFAATPGKAAVAARIVDARTGRRPSLPQSLVRLLGYLASLLPLGLGFLWIAFDRRKQGWHDKLAGTVVLDEMAALPRPVPPETAPEPAPAAARPAWLPGFRGFATALLALALANSLFVLLHRPGMLEGTAISGQALVVLVRGVSGVLAAALGLFLAWRAAHRPEARALALLLGFYFVGGRLLEFYLPAARVPVRSAVAVADWLILAALVRFAAVFPRRLLPADLRAAAARQLPGPLARTRWSAARAVGWVRGALRGAAARPPLREDWIATGAASSGWLDARVVWGAALTIGVGMQALYPRGGGRSTPPLLEFLVMVGVLFVIVRAFGLLRLNFRLSAEEERRRALWVFQGISLALLLPLAGAVLGVSAAFLLNLTGAIAGNPAAAEEGSRSVSYSVGYLVGLYAAVGPGLILTFAAAAAIFGRGAIDPRFTLRKTTLFGTMGVVLTGLFVAVEEVVSALVIGYVGLPDAVSAVLAGSVIAVVFGPVRNRVEATTNRLVDRMLPATALAEEGARGEAVVVFADLVGYTRLAAADEREALTLASLFHRTARTAAERRAGRQVKTIGDAVLLEFAVVDDAVAAVMEFTERFRTAAAALDLPRLAVRTGIHRGEVVRSRDGDLFGETVNLASRLEGIAAPDEIVASAAAAEALSAPSGFRAEQIGERTLKNVPAPVQCYRILAGDGASVGAG